jgi:uncharacterized protein (UPF0261 family)
MVYPIWAITDSRARWDVAICLEGRPSRHSDHMAGLIKDAKGPVVFFVPLRGFSAHDSEQGHLYEPSLPPVFAEYLKKVMPEGIPVITLPNHINDQQFAERIVEQALAFMK